MEIYNIILIENQISQFWEIVKFFRPKDGDKIIYNIFPKEDDQFINFMDNIRVRLNLYYPDNIREKALQNILSIINTSNQIEGKSTQPDAFIIDHKLVGCHNSLTGIHLAKELRKQGYINQPIIFLSRTLESDSNVMEGRKTLMGSHIWIPKGYAGKEINDKDYFEKNVLAVIPELIKKSGYMIYIDKLEKISRFPSMARYLDELKPIINSIKEKNEITDVHKKAIDNFLTLADEMDFSEPKIQEFLRLLCMEQR